VIIFSCLSFFAGMQWRLQGRKEKEIEKEREKRLLKSKL